MSVSGDTKLSSFVVFESRLFKILPSWRNYHPSFPSIIKNPLKVLLDRGCDGQCNPPTVQYLHSVIKCTWLIFFMLVSKKKALSKNCIVAMESYNYSFTLLKLHRHGYYSIIVVQYLHCHKVHRYDSYIATCYSARLVSLLWDCLVYCAELSYICLTSTSPS